MSPKPYTCPCCGYQTLDEPPGSYGICPICFWEDDHTQLLDPWYAGGANVPSLVEAQKNFQEYGASDERLVDLVRGIRPGDRRDPEWRTVEAADQEFVHLNRCLPGLVPEDLNGCYYWRRGLAGEEEEEDEVRDSHRGEELDWDPGEHVLRERIDWMDFWD